MNSNKKHLLAELLEEFSGELGEFIPNEVWNAAQKAFALPYLELAIVRRSSAGVVQILLTHRIDEYWNGWHIPGGLWRTRHTLEEGIAALIPHELGNKAKLTLLAKGGWEKWLDHPYGHIVSHVVICSGANIDESDTAKWFDAVPEGMINDSGHHASFIKTALEQAEKLV